jgi:hypothetical protein
MKLRRLAPYLLGFLTLGSPLLAAPIENVRVCDRFGPGFLYVPGTEICYHAMTGDVRQETEGGVWRSRLPYPSGRWVQHPRRECRDGRIVPIGTFESTDFTVNAWNRKQTEPVAVAIRDNEYVSKIMMSGGFFDPRLPGHRSGTYGTTVLCLRSLDPSIPEVAPEPNPGDPPVKPRWANGLLPLGCIANARILNIPATYVIAADASYPSVHGEFANEEQTEVSGPFTYASHIAVTTDVGNGGPNLLTYLDASDGSSKPLAGSVKISVCVSRAFPTLDGLP